MKEAIGGSWLYLLVITMITLFTTFVSVTTNYTRTYKVKDQLISIIETNDGVTTKTLEDISDYLSSLGYSATGKCPTDIAVGEQWFPFSLNNTHGPSGYGDNANYCIYKHIVQCVTGYEKVKTSEGTYYKVKREGSGGYYPRAYYGVSTFFRIDWPILRYMIKLNLTGETSTIALVTNSNEIDIFKNNTCS